MTNFDKVFLFILTVLVTTVVLFGMASWFFPGLLEEFGYWGIYWRFMVMKILMKLMSEGVERVAQGGK